MTATDSYMQEPFLYINPLTDFPQMSPEQQQIYMRSLNNYRTFLATKDYDYNLGHEEGRIEERINNARLMIAAGVDRMLVISTLQLTDDQIEEL